MTRVLITAFSLLALMALSSDAVAQRCSVPERPACERDFRGCCTASDEKPSNGEATGKVVKAKRPTARKVKKTPTGNGYAECHTKGQCARYCKKSTTCGTDADYESDPWIQVAMRTAACDLGNGDACSTVGLQYEQGVGVMADASAGVLHYMRGCELGSLTGCYYAGFNLARGIGTEVSPYGALGFLQLACDGGIVEACTSLGALYASGTMGEADFASALPLYERGCDGGDGYGCYNAAFVYYGGKGVAKDEAKAVSLWEQSCIVGRASGCTQAGIGYLNGKGVALDASNALYYFLAGCTLGDSYGCSIVDQAAEKAGADAAPTLARLDELCAGYPTNEGACLAIAQLHTYGGYMGSENRSKGFALYQASCDRGQADACIAVGWAYLVGHGVDASAYMAAAVLAPYCTETELRGCAQLISALQANSENAAAFDLSARMCELNDGVSCVLAGYSFYLGQGTTWDTSQAIPYYVKACALGTANGCNNLAEAQQYGTGTDRDLETSRAGFEELCEKSDVYACARVGMFYEEGLGVSVDLAQARTYYEKSCPARYGDTYGCGRLSLILRKEGADEAKVSAMAQQAFREASDFVAQNPYARFLLGVFYRDGIGTIRDLEKAGAEMFAGCEAQESVSCIEGAQFYLGSHGGTVDFDLAAAMAEKACAAKSALGCELSTQARNRIPLTPRKGGCAGCSGGAGAGGILVGLVVLALLIRPTRTRRRAR